VVHPRAGHPNTGSTRNWFNAICAEFSRPLATSSSPASVSAVRLSVDPKLAGLRDLARNQAVGDLPEDQAGLDVRYGPRPTMEPTTGYGDGTALGSAQAPCPQKRLDLFVSQGAHGRRPRRQTATVYRALKVH
jgi:hypothetical protein